MIDLKISEKLLEDLLADPEMVALAIAPDEARAALLSAERQIIGQLIVKAAAYILACGVPGACFVESDTGFDVAREDEL